MSFGGGGADNTGMTQVNFQDEFHDEEADDGDLQVDFAPRLSHHNGTNDEEDYDPDSSDALLEEMDSSLHPPQRPRGRRSMCKAFLVLIPICGLIGAGLYFLYTAGTDKTGSTTAAGGTKSAYLTPPPANLASKCATADSLDCKQVCEPAECCDFPANLALSCLASHETDCLTYHQYCSILTGGNVLPAETSILFPPVPSNLKDICSASNIGTVDGFQECQEACSPASCCYADKKDNDQADGTCTNAACSDYAACLVLSASDHIHADIGPHVETECSDLDTTGGRSKCRVACSHALCCFSNDMCPHPDDSFCDQYAICNELEVDVDVVSTATEINQICTTSTHTSLCEVVCEHGACCFASERCPEGSDVVCTDYAGCSVLYGETKDDDAANSGGGSSAEESSTGSTTTESSSSTGAGSSTTEHNSATAEQIFEACADHDTEMVNMPGVPTLCQKMCGQYSCCFDDDNDACSDADSIKCDTGASCAELYGKTVESTGGGSTTSDSGGDTLGITFKTDVDDACIDFNPAAANAATSECAKLCKDAGCCFETAGCSTSINCDTYEECDAFYGVDSDDDEEESTTTGGGSSTTGGNTDHNSATSEQIFEACADHDTEMVNVPGTPTLCQKMCEQYSCCFSDCTPSSDVTCDTGASCAELFVQSTGGGSSSGSNSGSNSGSSGTAGITFKADVDDACVDFNPAQADAATSECAKLCQDVACCFTGPGCSTAINCDTYEECDVIYGANDDSDDEEGGGDGTAGITFKADVDDACIDFNPAAANAATSECAKLCENAGCCFLESGCSTAINCQTYEECDAFFGTELAGSGSGDDGNTGLTFKADIDDACIDFNPAVADASTSECAKLCENAGCCFLASGCSTSIDCKKYEECDIIYGVESDDEESTDDGSSTGITFKADVDDACIDFNPASADASTSECSKLCANVACCFTGAGCSTDIDCKKYEECDVIYGTDDSNEESTGDGSNGITFKADIDDACIDLNPAAADASTSECAKLCEDVGCCFTGAGCSSGIDCKKYEECDVIYGGADGDDDEEATGSSEHNSATSEQIFEACEDHDTEMVNMPGTPTLCQKMCDQYSCCFDDSCAPPSDVNCDTGAFCADLFAKTSGSSGGGSDSDQPINPDQYTKEDINAACSGGDAVTSMCTKLCDPAECCFRTSMACGSNLSDCTKYESCMKVWERL